MYYMYHVHVCACMMELVACIHMYVHVHVYTYCVHVHKYDTCICTSLCNPDILCLTEHPVGFQPPTPPGTPNRKSLLIPVPSEQSLCLPIRRYIAENLICHVLGQPSYSLACLMVSTMNEYLGVKLPSVSSSVQVEEPLQIG